MTASTVKTSSAAAGAYLLVPIVLFFALLIVAVLRSESLVTSAGLGSAVIVATPLVLATYALMVIAIAGRGTVDLSIGPLIGFINVTLVTLFGGDIISSPIAFFLYALGVGVAYQLFMGLVIVFVRVQPIIVSLSGYLALSGVNLVIMERPGGTAPEWMMDWGLGISIFSPVTAILVIATVAWLIFTQTAFYGHLRLMGADERAAYTSGVRINLVRLGAHVISGLFAGLAALTFTSLISSGDPTQGTTYTLIAVTALVLGGASLAGGRGGVMGSLLGAVNIYLITYVLATFNFGAVQSFVTDLAYGTILVLSLLLTIVLPHIRGVVQSISPLLFFVILSLIALGVIIHATYDYSAPGQAISDGASTGMVSLSGEPLQAPAAPPPEAETPAVAQPFTFIFEASPSDSAIQAPSSLWPPLAAAALLLLSLVIILRASIAQAERSSGLSPLVYAVVTGVVLLGVYAVTVSIGASTPGDKTSGTKSSPQPANSP